MAEELGTRSTSFPLIVKFLFNNRISGILLSKIFCFKLETYRLYWHINLITIENSQVSSESRRPRKMTPATTIFTLFPVYCFSIATDTSCSTVTIQQYWQCNSGCVVFVMNITFQSYTRQAVRFLKSYPILMFFFQEVYGYCNYDTV